MTLVKRRWLALGPILMLIAAACVDEGRPEQAIDKSGLGERALRTAALPFGLVEPTGVEAIGRPATFDEAQISYNGVPLEGHSLRAAYWVTADNPAAVIRDWAEQLGRGLDLDSVVIERGKGPGNPWVEVSGFSPSGEPSDWATVQLWATDKVPLLLVDIHRVESGTNQPKVTDNLARLGEPRAVLATSERTAGDELLTVGGATLHLPVGSRSLTPMVPPGIDGSDTVLAAEDADAAIEALLDEARTLSDFGEVIGPEVTKSDGVRVVRVHFNIPAGGWSFSILAVQAPDDPYATLYVHSAPG